MIPLNYILFLQILIFLFITPGTPRIVIISHSMNYGVKHCIWTALGDVSANTIQHIYFILHMTFIKLNQKIQTQKISPRKVFFPFIGMVF